MENKEYFADLDVVAAVKEWVETDSPETFDPAFIKSIHNYWEVHDRITSRQRIALDNIVEKFDIDVESYL